MYKDEGVFRNYDRKEGIKIGDIVTLTKKYADVSAGTRGKVVSIYAFHGNWGKSKKTGGIETVDWKIGRLSEPTFDVELSNGNQLPLSRKEIRKVR